MIKWSIEIINQFYLEISGQNKTRTIIKLLLILLLLACKERRSVMSRYHGSIISLCQQTQQ